MTDEVRGGPTGGPTGTGLAGVLARRTPPGVYRWVADARVAGDVGAADRVRHEVERAGWGFAHLDGGWMDSRSGFLHEIGVVLDLPEHYGRNFDALADCLYDVPAAGGAGGLVLLWDGWGALARADERAFGLALEVLGDRAAAERESAFTVLLRGDGPPVDVPELP